MYSRNWDGGMPSIMIDVICSADFNNVPHGQHSKNVRHDRLFVAFNNITEKKYERLIDDDYLMKIYLAGNLPIPFEL